MSEDTPRVEERVRAMLDRHAAHAPLGTAMLGAVQRASLRRTRRRRATVGIAVAALTFVALAAGLTAARLGPWGPAAPPVGSGAPVRIVAGSVDVTVPFSLSTPFEYGEPVGTLVGGTPVLTFTAQRAGLGPITVEVLGTPPAFSGKILANPGRWLLAEEDKQWVVWWTTAGDAWIRLAAPAAYPASLLNKILAATDRTASMRVGTPVRFDSVPEGFTVDNIDASIVSFCPPGVAPGPGTAGKLVVSWPEQPLDPPPTVAVPATAAIDVARPGDGSMLVTVDSAASGRLFIRVPPGVTMSREDLLRFAAGIHRGT